MAYWLFSYPVNVYAYGIKFNVIFAYACVVNLWKANGKFILENMDSENIVGTLTNYLYW